MASYKILISLLVLYAIVTVAQSQASQGGPQTSQGGPHQNQEKSRQQADQELNQDQEQNEDSQDDNNDSRISSWTTCNYTVDPKLTCQDCSTRMICKPIGALLKRCGNPSKPYCNNGICSPEPSIECA